MIIICTTYRLFHNCICNFHISFRYLYTNGHGGVFHKSKTRKRADFKRERYCVRVLSSAFVKHKKNSFANLSAVRPISSLSRKAKASAWRREMTTMRLPRAGNRIQPVKRVRVSLEFIERARQISRTGLQARRKKKRGRE